MNTLLYNPRVKEEIKGEIRNYFELTQNENTTLLKFVRTFPGAQCLRIHLPMQGTRA